MWQLKQYQLQRTHGGNLASLGKDHSSNIFQGARGKTGQELPKRCQKPHAEKSQSSNIMSGESGKLDQGLHVDKHQSSQQVAGKLAKHDPPPDVGETNAAIGGYEAALGAEGAREHQEYQQTAGVEGRAKRHLLAMMAAREKERMTGLQGEA